MFERFTDRARRVVVLAQEEARTLGHDRVRTEHILLGLVDEGEGVAAKVLDSLGIGAESVHQRVTELVGRGAQAGEHLPGRIRFAEESKDVLKLALNEALRFGHHYIGTEHILLGLLREGEGAAAQVLTGLGADLDGAREETTRLLEEYRRRHGDQTG